MTLLLMCNSAVHIDLRPDLKRDQSTERCDLTESNYMRKDRSKLLLLRRLNEDTLHLISNFITDVSQERP